MASFRAGKLGGVTITTQVLAMLEWAVTNRGADLDTSNFESNGIEEGLVGMIGADWSIRANWDAAKNPLDDPPGLFPRDNGTDMKLAVNKVDDKGYIFPFWRCLNSKITTTTTGLVTFDADGKNQGPFTAPTGSVVPALEEAPAAFGQGPPARPLPTSPVSPSQLAAAEGAR